jgi:hypothetical protein
LKRLQAKIFTAEPQRTPRSHFLFGGERPPNKKLLPTSKQNPFAVPEQSNVV